MGHSQKQETVCQKKSFRKITIFETTFYRDKQNKVKSVFLLCLSENVRFCFVTHNSYF